MAINLKQGAIKKSPKDSYTIVKELNKGAFAAAYAATTTTGRTVFFKEYKSPSPTIKWFNGYVDYQQEIKRRIESDPETRTRTYEFIDFFTDRFFYQVFEFVEDGMSLTDCIARQKKDSSAFSWKDRIFFARLMMKGMAAFHDKKIIHTDLKPDNVYLIPNQHNPGVYLMRVIDLDFAILADKRAPWHGEQGYVGTPNYQSPEHLRGEVPQLSSDIFTCGLMLAELLGCGHPFRKAPEYGKAILAGDQAIPFRLEQSFGNTEYQTKLETLVNQCFSSEASRRPNASQLWEALRPPKVVEPPALSVASPAALRPIPVIITPEVIASSPPPSVSAKPIASATLAAPASNSTLEVNFEGQKLFSVNIDSDFGKRVFKGIHADAQYVGENQFKLYRDPSAKQWMIAHDPSATNETIVNGSKLAGPMLVTDGIRVSVGNSSKGIEKFPLTINVR